MLQMLKKRINDCGDGQWRAVEFGRRVWLAKAKRKELKMVMLLWLHRESVIIQVCGQKFEGKRAQVQFRVEAAVEVCILRF